MTFTPQGHDQLVVGCSRQGAPVISLASLVEELVGPQTSPFWIWAFLSPYGQTYTIAVFRR